MVSLRIPVATYRLQFNSGFRFEDARAIVPYLQRLGITDLYASPILKARQGSSHGYDVTDPTSLNPELGTEQELDVLDKELKTYEIGLLLDIVPNHMSANPENPWWADILENGRSSLYGRFFDIRWKTSNRSLNNKVLLPVLGTPYRQTLEEGELVLMLDKTGFFLDYHGLRLPLNIKSYAVVISHRFNKLEAALGATSPVIQQLRQLINNIECLPSCVRCTTKEIQQRHVVRQQLKEDFLYLINSSPEIKFFLSENITIFNGNKRNPGSFNLLDSIISQQSYQLAYLKTSLNDINYRRFFNINDLVGIRIEEHQVFRATHALVLQLVHQGKVTGLRIDHIDGLYDPLGYLRRLHYHLTRKAQDSSRQPGFYTVVEKILSGDETLPEEWPVFGTTGYDFLKVVNNLFVDENGIQNMKSVYSNFTGLESEFEDSAYQKKKQVMEKLFNNEIHSLGHKLVRLARQDWLDRHDISEKEFTKILIEVTACLPVYRTYIHSFQISPRDQKYLGRAIEEAQRRNHNLDIHAIGFVKRILMLDSPVQLGSKLQKEWLQFVMRWQQHTGAVMAKGVEDTAFYNFNLLISLNVVGGDPGNIVLPVDAFHQHNLSTRANCPYTLNATATHDTKRGEDVRMRLNVLSEMPEIWERHVEHWMQLNQAKKTRVNGQVLPDLNMEMFVYQTLIGAWPLSDQEVPQFKERIEAYILKAAREAKSFTSWISPNSEYESAILSFLNTILDNHEQNEFLKNFLEFQQQVAYYGALNSLSQVLLKIASPGVSDFYQGTELWDLNLVDPDNRRPVDYNIRSYLLDKLVEQEPEKQKELLSKLLDSWQDGQIKLYVTYKALNTRRAYPDVFLDGDYIPIKVEGQRQEHICAFARNKGNTWALIVIPRLISKLVQVGTLPTGQQIWRDDVLPLPEGTPCCLTNIFTRENIRVTPACGGVPLSTIFHRFPIALLVGSP